MTLIQSVTVITCTLKAARRTPNLGRSEVTVPIVPQLIMEAWIPSKQRVIQASLHKSDIPTLKSHRLALRGRVYHVFLTYSLFPDPITWSGRPV